MAQGLSKKLDQQNHLAEKKRPAENFDEKTRPDFLRRVPEHSEAKSDQNVNKVQKKNNQKKIKSEIVFSRPCLRKNSSEI